MKRWVLAILMPILLILMLLVPALSEAAGTVTTTKSRLAAGMAAYTMSWTADAADGSVPATASPVFNGYVFLVATNPGATAPTDNYDITLTDSDGVDISGGELLNRDTISSEQAVPKVGAIYGSRYVEGGVTLNLTGNSVNSATGTVKIYVYE